jgi:hypothetical protein
MSRELRVEGRVPAPTRGSPNGEEALPRDPTGSDQPTMMR